MPVLDRVAKFKPLQPGYAKLTLNRFNALQLLGPNYGQRIELLVVRRNEAALADWHSPAPDGFISIIPKNPRQHAMDFEFEVGPDVVNPMAFDNSGDYILRIRDVNGIIMSFSVAMQGSPRAGSVFQDGSNLNPLNAQGKVMQPRGTTPTNSAAAPGATSAAGAAGVGAAGVAGATSAAGAAGMGVGAPNAASGPNNLYVPPAQAGAMGQASTSNLDAVSSGGGNALKIIAVLVIVFGLLGGAGFFFRNELAGLLGLDLGSDTTVEQSLEADATSDGANAADEANDANAKSEKAAEAALAMIEDESAPTSVEPAQTQAAAQTQAPVQVPAQEMAENAHQSDAHQAATNAAAVAAMAAGESVSHQGVKGIANSNMGGAQHMGGAAPMSAAQACTLVGNTGTDQTVIARCLNAKPSAEQINNLLREALQNNRCEIALKILSSKGRSPNGGNYAYVYGLMADPGVRGGSKCIIKKSDDASYWYEQAKKDPNFDRKEAIKLANFLVM